MTGLVDYTKIKTMRTLHSSLYYFYWHYSFALISLVGVWWNFVVFVLNFFSVNQMIKTLFSPWYRLGERYPRSLDLEKFFTALVANTLMRLVGAVVKLVIIFTSLVVLLIVFLAGIFFFIVWLLAPVLIVAFLVFGFYLFSI